MGVTEAVWQNAVFGHAVEHPVRSDDGGIDSAGEDERAHQDDEGVEQQTQGDGAGEEHREAANQVVEILDSFGVRNNHDGEEGDERGEHHAEDENDESGALQVLQLGIGSLLRSWRAANGRDR